MYLESDNENNENGVDVLIGAGQKAIERGDYNQAERLLKTSLTRLQLQSRSTTKKMKAVLQRLIQVYELDGKSEDVAALKEQLADLDEGKEAETLKALLFDAHGSKSSAPGQAQKGRKRAH